MSSAARKFAVFACLVAAVAAFTGCKNTRERGAGREGLPADIGHLQYNVFITRELNLRDLEDQGYYKGPEAPPGYALYGVFLQACNRNSGGPAWTSASSFVVEDTQGNRFTPLRLPADNIWAYKARSLKENDCIPQIGSLASSGPTNGSLLIFRLPLTSLENRPLDLRITSPADSTGRRESGLIELDI